MREEANIVEQYADADTSGRIDILAKVLQTTPNYLLGFADNNDGFADEALGLLRDFNLLKV